jgi:hypothetical protein
MNSPELSECLVVFKRLANRSRTLRVNFVVSKAVGIKLSNDELYGSREGTPLTGETDREEC